MATITIIGDNKEINSRTCNEIQNWFKKHGFETITIDFPFSQESNNEIHQHLHKGCIIIFDGFKISKIAHTKAQSIFSVYINVLTHMLDIQTIQKDFIFYLDNKFDELYETWKDCSSTQNIFESVMCRNWNVIKCENIPSNEIILVLMENFLFFQEIHTDSSYELKEDEPTQKKRKKIKK